MSGVAGSASRNCRQLSIHASNNEEFPLLESALDLIERQGFAETTINQIAAAVDVSPRTLLRYFPTKEDVIVSWVEECMGIFLSSLADRPADEAPHLSLFASARALLAVYQARCEFFLVIERTIASSPAISARKLAMSSALLDKVSNVLRQRSPQSARADLASDLYPALVFAIVRVAIKLWVAGNGQRKLVDIFDEATALGRMSVALGRPARSADGHLSAKGQGWPTDAADLSGQIAR
eukprot:gene21629-22550_t